PSATMRAATCGSRATALPTRKKAPFTPRASSASSTAVVAAPFGPSSKVSATWRGAPGPWLVTGPSHDAAGLVAPTQPTTAGATRPYGLSRPSGQGTKPAAAPHARAPSVSATGYVADRAASADNPVIMTASTPDPSRTLVDAPVGRASPNASMNTTSSAAHQK